MGPRSVHESLNCAVTHFVIEIAHDDKIFKFVPEEIDSFFDLFKEIAWALGGWAIYAKIVAIFYCSKFYFDGAYFNVNISIPSLAKVRRSPPFLFLSFLKGSLKPSIMIGLG